MYSGGFTACVLARRGGNFGVFRGYSGDFTIENRMHFGPPQAENFGVFRGYSSDFTIENHIHFGPPQAENFGK